PSGPATTASIRRAARSSSRRPPRSTRSGAMSGPTRSDTCRWTACTRRSGRTSRSARRATRTGTRCRSPRKSRRRRWPSSGTGANPRPPHPGAPSEDRGPMDSHQTSGTQGGAGFPAGRPYVPARPTVAIDDTKLRERFEKFEEGARKIRWDAQGPVQIDWSIFDRSKLTLDNLFVVKLVTFVESYADVYTALLLDKFCTNDTMATFFQLWEREEQNHADKLVAYTNPVGL